MSFYANIFCIDYFFGLETLILFPFDFQTSSIFFNLLTYEREPLRIFFEGFIHKINSLPLKCAKWWGELSRWFSHVQICWCYAAVPLAPRPTTDLLTVFSWILVYLCLVGLSVPQQSPWAGISGGIILKRNPFLTDLDTHELHWSQCRATLNKCRNLIINSFIKKSLQKSLLVNTSMKFLKCKLST